MPDGAERVRWEESDFLKRFDIEGRQLDLYSLRTTLGTHLARHNTASQVAQRIMRHAKMQTTLDHYTDLRIADEAMAIESMPAIDIKIKTTTTEADTVQEVSATGTDDVVANWQRIDSEQGAFSGDDGQPVAKCDITGPAGADPCEESQVTYNLVDGDDCRRMATQGVQADENDRKSLKHGPLAQLASAPL